MPFAVAVAACVVAALALVTAIQSHRVVANERRQNARERDMLLNQLLHLAGRTWQPPPSEAPVALDPEQGFVYAQHPSAMPDLYGDDT